MILSMEDVGKHPFYSITLLRDYIEGTYDSVTCPWYVFIRDVI